MTFASQFTELTIIMTHISKGLWLG